MESSIKSHSLLRRTASYGSTVLAASKKEVVRIDSDIVLVKLMLAIILFSTFDYTIYMNAAPVQFDDVKAVLRIQEVYVELAWRYLVYKYGYSRAVISFSNLIRCILAVNEATVVATTQESYTHLIDSLLKQTKETLSLNN